MPAFPLTTSQLSKYNLKYLGKDQLDEISCYIFEVKPRVAERKNAYFQGIVCIDDKYMEVVKTYGSWVNDLGEMKSSPQLPFTMFRPIANLSTENIGFRRMRAPMKRCI